MYSVSCFGFLLGKAEQWMGNHIVKNNSAEWICFWLEISTKLQINSFNMSMNQQEVTVVFGNNFSIRIIRKTKTPYISQNKSFLMCIGLFKGYSYYRLFFVWTLRRRGIPQNFRLSKIDSKIRYIQWTNLGDILCILFFAKEVPPILRNKRTFAAKSR